MFSGSVPELVDTTVYNELENMIKTKIIPKNINHFHIFYKEYIESNVILLFMIFSMVAFVYVLYKYRRYFKNKRKNNEVNPDDIIDLLHFTR